MLTSTDDRRIECVQAALDCRTCLQASATSVARLSPDLGRGTLQQMFFQMYPDPACACRADLFVRAYRESTDRVRPGIVTIVTAVACA
jgi:hypothetical protein